MKNTVENNGKDNAKEMRPLQSNKAIPNTLVRQTWLHYYNNYLLEHGVISQEEWRKMRLKIETS